MLGFIVLLDFHNKGKWLGSRQIRCNWATKGAGVNDDKQSLDDKNEGEVNNNSSGNLLNCLAQTSAGSWNKIKS